MTMNREKVSVSYGIYSCSLEAFDDPFSEICKITNMFRELAEKDRHFGIVEEAPVTPALQLEIDDPEPLPVPPVGDDRQWLSRACDREGHRGNFEIAQKHPSRLHTQSADLRRASVIAHSLQDAHKVVGREPDSHAAIPEAVDNKSKYSDLRTVLIP
jgi:hypothetical protein